MLGWFIWKLMLLFYPLNIKKQVDWLYLSRHSLESWTNNIPLWETDVAMACACIRFIHHPSCSQVYLSYYGTGFYMWLILLPTNSEIFVEKTKLTSTVITNLYHCLDYLKNLICCPFMKPNILSKSKPY